MLKTILGSRYHPRYLVPPLFRTIASFIHRVVIELRPNRGVFCLEKLLQGHSPLRVVRQQDDKVVRQLGEECADWLQVLTQMRELEELEDRLIHGFAFPYGRVTLS